MLLSVPRVQRCCLEHAAKAKVTRYGEKITLAKYIELARDERWLRYIRLDHPDAAAIRAHYEEKQS